MSLFILFLLFTSLIGTSLLLHYGFDFFNAIPDTSAVSITEKEYFAIDYTFFMNTGFLALSGLLIYLGFFKGKDVKHHKEIAPKSPLLGKVLKWLAIGIVLKYIVV